MEDGQTYRFPVGKKEVFITFRVIRYKKNVNDKTQLVHTLNASSLALPRLMVAIIETYQNSDGTISIPDILKPYYL